MWSIFLTYTWAVVHLVLMYSLTFSVLKKSGLKPAVIDRLLTGTGLAGLGRAFASAEARTGVNSLFMVAHAAVESAWGRSNIAITKRNLFGIAAFDSDPGAAYSFKSKAASIAYYAEWLKKQYLTKGGDWFEGTSIHAIFIHYSSSHDVEARLVARIMNELESKLHATSGVPPPVPTATGSVYLVKPGDNLTLIARRYRLSLARLKRANPQYAANWNLIHPKDIVKIPR